MAAFPDQPIRGFNRTDIESLNPGQIGCYGIYRAGVWIYVGKGDIRQRLLDHLNGDNPDILREKPTNWVGLVTDNLDAEEKRLIIECNPICNKKIG